MLIGAYLLNDRDFLSIMKHLSYSPYERALSFFVGEIITKTPPKNMLELTFAEIAVSFYVFLHRTYPEKIKSNGVLNLEISSPPFKKTHSEKSVY